MLVLKGDVNTSFIDLVAPLMMCYLDFLARSQKEKWMLNAQVVILS